MSALAFDKVAVQKAGGFNMMNAAQFMAIPRQERMQLLLNGKVKFMKGSAMVPATTAIMSIRKAG